MRISDWSSDVCSSDLDLYDERGDELESGAVQFHDLGGHVAFDGPVRTVRCHRDNALVKGVLATPGQGAVLVIAGGGSLESALVGDLIAASAASNGWAGPIVHGAVRDAIAPAERSDVGRGGKEWVRTGRSQWAPIP